MNYNILTIILSFYLFPGASAIVGGTSAEITNAPFMASLQYGGKHCGGAVIISTTLLITAAHCIFGNSGETCDLPEHYSIRVDSNYWADGGEVVFAESFVLFPGFKSSSKYPDIAVIRLKNSLLFTQIVKPASLDMDFDISRPRPAHITKVAAYGWGLTSYKGSGSPVLKVIQQ